MKNVLIAIILLGSVSLLSAAYRHQYFFVNSTNTVSKNLEKTSTEIYIIKFSTPEAYVNFTGTTILTNNLTNYFLLPATDTNNAFEHIETITTDFIAIYSTNTPGVTPNIRIKVKK